jgi:hypothetical protein
MSREDFTFRVSRRAKACEKASRVTNSWYTGDEAINIHQPGTAGHCCNKGFHGKPISFEYSGDETRFNCPASDKPKSGLEPCKLNRSGYAVGRTW